MNKRQEASVHQWEAEDKIQSRIDGVVIGIVAKTDDSGMAYVEYPSCPSSVPLPAHSTVPISPGDVGREVDSCFLMAIL